MARTKEELARHVLRSVLGVVRYEDDIPQVKIEEAIVEYDALYFELKDRNLTRTIDDEGEPVVWAVDEIPEQSFKAVAMLTAARLAPAFSVDDPPDEEEAMRWLYKVAQIPKKLDTIKIQEF